MGNLRACFALAAGLAACGNDHGNAIDAPKLIDGAIDAKPIDTITIDAALYDFSCMANSQPTTAPATVSYAGTTQAISTGGLAALGTVLLNAYDAANPGTSLATTTSGTDGTYTASIATGGVALEVFVKATKATYRTTYEFSPNNINADATGVLVPLVSDTTFTTLSGFAGATQDDTMNGALFIQVLDCGGTAVKTATLNVKQAGADVGTVFDLGQFLPQAAGNFFAFNVPDGDTQISATLGTTTFPTTAHTVTVHKKPTGDTAEGTITITQIVPGPPS